MSILPRISLLAVVATAALAACSPEQSQNIGAQPKKTIDRAQTNLDKAMQQSTERVKDEDAK